MSKPTPMDEGKLAASQGKPVSVNPYPVDSDEHAEWDEGYYFVKDTDEEGEPKDDA